MTRGNGDRALIDRLPGDVRKIAELCGLDTALLICREFGGTRPYIPKLDDLYREVRDAKIRADYDAGGVTVAMLARRYKLSERQIFNILGCPPEEDKNFSLPLAD
jgi:Mor family transcriptional regulator